VARKSYLFARRIFADRVNLGQTFHRLQPPGCEGGKENKVIHFGTLGTAGVISKLVLSADGKSLAANVNGDFIKASDSADANMR
jgi:hypothetical protein